MDTTDGRVSFRFHNAEQQQTLWSYEIDNRIRTTEYTKWNFVFKNLFKQFHRPANIYFFVIMLLQTWDAVSITNGNPSLASPLAFVLFVSALKDAIEDYRRHEYDYGENHRFVEVLSGFDENNQPLFKKVFWYTLVAGDIVKIYKNDQVPADLILLESEDKINRLGHAMTAGLDGETNLKQRQVHHDCPESIDNFDYEKSHLVRAAPNSLLDSFDVVLNYTDKQSPDETKSIPITNNNIMLRGSQLRNVGWVIGILAYVGEETKVQLNSSIAQYKTSAIMKISNRVILLMLLVQVSICFCAAIMSVIYASVIGEPYYLMESNTNAFFQMFQKFCTYMIIFANFIPISLIVTIDMVKFGQAYFIENDIEIYYGAMDRRATVHSSELNGDLGFVEHIFTDKTGTLTANKMRFVACSIGDQLAHANESLQIDSTAMDPEMTRLFWTCLSINHNVMIEVDDSGVRNYSADSLDEEELVRAAKANDFAFTNRTRKEISIAIKDKETNFTLLHNLEFTSSRKRSSVIVKDNNGDIFVFAKGADSTIFERLANTVDPVVEQSKQFVNELASTGLRTLCIAYRPMSEDEYDNWNNRYTTASANLQDRKSLMSALEEEIECKLILLGCTAIEDRLQEGVPESLVMLRLAGIKVWMLTGDKVDTAVTIAKLSKLWHPGMLLHYLTKSDEDDGDILTRISNTRNKFETSSQQPQEQGACLVIDHNVVMELDTPDARDSFLQLSRCYASVICARVSPEQKATIVKMVQEADPTLTTLAIGDGANDVPMIQCAKIGVGIYGEEGLQSANNADFAIGRFRFLQKLLLVHGRWNTRRIGTVVCYMFYKNVAMVLPQFLFSFFCLASGQNFFADYPFYQGYNLLFTSLPILFFGVLDQDVSSSLANSNPQIYGEASIRPHQGIFFNTVIFWKWIAEGFLVAITITLVNFMGLQFGNEGVVYANGATIDLWQTGTAIHAVVTLFVTLRIFLENYYVTWMMGLSYLISIVSWIFCGWFWSNYTYWIPGFINSNYLWIGGVMHVFSSADVWCTMILALVMCWLPVISLKAYSNLHPPMSLKLRLPKRNIVVPQSQRSILHPESDATPNSEGREISSFVT